MADLSELCTQTIYMKLFSAMQLKEVDEHQYFIKEKFVKLYGRELEDLAYSNVLKHWCEFGYAKNFRERFEKHYLDYVRDICGDTCDFKCPGIKGGGCVLSIEQIHRILEDGGDMSYADKRELFSNPSELEVLVGKKP